MNHDGNAVGRQLHVDLETVGAERDAVVDRRHGVFRRELRAAAMGEDERRRGLEDGRTTTDVHRLLSFQAGPQMAQNALGRGLGPRIFP